MLLALLQLPRLPLLALTLPVELPESEPDSHTPPRRSVAHFLRARAGHTPVWQIVTIVSDEPKHLTEQERKLLVSNRLVWEDSHRYAEALAFLSWNCCSSGSCSVFHCCYGPLFSTRALFLSLTLWAHCALEGCCRKNMLEVKKNKQNKKTNTGVSLTCLLCP